MTAYGVALDLGTSGFRAQAIDLENGKTVSTAITVRHPLPGANVMDHVNYAIEAGEGEGNKLIISTVDRLVRRLQIDPRSIVRVAVCGNPFQLSLFQNIEVRDLAYAGRRKLEALKVVPPKRDGDVIPASDLGLHLGEAAEVIIPPAVGHEIGADALAMLLMTGALEEKGPCMVIDYGTNAEMALVADGQIFTGSAAAGPALEGQEVQMGMLAAPGAISDVNMSEEGWTCSVLDDEFMPVMGDTVDPTIGKRIMSGPMHGRSKGITGTGVVAALSCGLAAGLIVPPKIGTADHAIHLQDGIMINERDVSEAGKAIGAIRAGYLTLMNLAGVGIMDVRTAFMSGATGIYVDAIKAQRLGLVPIGADRIVQVGNTSLSLAREMVMRPEKLDELRTFARGLRSTHCMFATSETFKNIYSIELSLWTYGMPMSAYNDMLDIYSLPHMPLEPTPNVAAVKRMDRDIPDLGPLGIAILPRIGVELCCTVPGCTRCQKCVDSCPEDALDISFEEGGSVVSIRSELCAGTACRRCEMACPSKVLHLSGTKAKDIAF